MDERPTFIAQTSNDVLGLINNFADSPRRGRKDISQSSDI